MLTNAVVMPATPFGLREPERSGIGGILAACVGRSLCRSPRSWDRLEPSFATVMDHPGCQLWDHWRVVRRIALPLANTSVDVWRSLLAFREVRVIEVRGVLRCWLAGDGFRAV